MMIVAGVVGSILLLVAVFLSLVSYFSRRKDAGRAEEDASDVPFAVEVDRAIASPSIPPEIAMASSDGAKSVARAGMSPRETLELDLRERSTSGRCLICQERATYSMPRRTLVRSLLDPLFRYYGIVASDRYRIDVHSDIDHPPCLCEKHHLIVRAALERKATEMLERYAAFVEKGRYEMLEYERYEVFETVLAHEQEIRGRKPQKKQRGSLAAVVTIGEKKASGG